LQDDKAGHMTGLFLCLPLTVSHSRALPEFYGATLETSYEVSVQVVKAS
jgi:hypothetical protein